MIYINYSISTTTNSTIPESIEHISSKQIQHINICSNKTSQEAWYSVPGWSCHHISLNIYDHQTNTECIKKQSFNAYKLIQERHVSTRLVKVVNKSCIRFPDRTPDWIELQIGSDSRSDQTGIFPFWWLKIIILISLLTTRCHYHTLLTPVIFLIVSSEQKPWKRRPVQKRVHMKRNKISAMRDICTSLRHLRFGRCHMTKPRFGIVIAWISYATENFPVQFRWK